MDSGGRCAARPRRARHRAHDRPSRGAQCHRPGHDARARRRARRGRGAHRPGYWWSPAPAPRVRGRRRPEGARGDPHARGRDGHGGDHARVLDRLATLPMPVLAAVNGDAYGGGAEVAVACDIRIAADDVQCAFNQVALGIMPAWGGIERLTALVGRGRALALMTTGRVLDAEAALDAGPVRRSGAARAVRRPLARGRGADRARRRGTRSSASRPPSSAAFPTARPRPRRAGDRLVRADLGRGDHWRWSRKQRAPPRRRRA